MAESMILPAPNPRKNPAAVRIAKAKKPKNKPKAKAPPTFYERVTKYAAEFLSPSKSKKSPTGSTGSAKLNLESAKSNVARITRELQDEASKGGRGDRYDKLVVQMEAAQAAEQKAFRALQAAEKAREQKVVTDAKIASGSAVAGLVAGKTVTGPAIVRSFEKSIEKQRGSIAAAASAATSVRKDLEKAVKAKDAFAVKTAQADLRALSKTGKKVPKRAALGVGVSGVGLVIGAGTLYRGITEGNTTLIATGTGEVSLAATTLGATALGRQNPKTPIPIKDLAKLEAAGKIGRMKVDVATRKPRSRKPPVKTRAKAIKAPSLSQRVSVVEKTLGIAGRAARALPAVGLAVTAGLVGLEVLSGGSQALAAGRKGDARGAGKAAGRTAVNVVDMLSFNALTRTKKGLSDIAATVSNPNFVSNVRTNVFGTGLTKVTVPPSNLYARQVALGHARKQRASRRDAAVQVAGKLKPLKTLNASVQSKRPTSDGYTDAHFRRTDGKAVRVRGYKTPK